MSIRASHRQMDRNLSEIPLLSGDQCFWEVPNVLNAFWFMVNYVLTSNQQLHKTIARSPFKFDPETPARPSSFEVIFTTEGVRYAYGFSVTD